MNIFDNIKQAADRHGVIMKEVCSKLGMTYAQLKERVNSKEFNLEDITQIAMAIGCEDYEIMCKYNPEVWIRCPHCGNLYRVIPPSHKSP